MAAANERDAGRGAPLICSRAALVDGGRALRFSVEFNGRVSAAFVIAFDGAVYAYANRCPHRGTELDWRPGEVFDESGIYLVCATHGALFEADTGYCVSGPCHGSNLKPMMLDVMDGEVRLPRKLGRLVGLG